MLLVVGMAAGFSIGSARRESLAGLESTLHKLNATHPPEAQAHEQDVSLLLKQARGDRGVSARNRWALRAGVRRWLRSDAVACLNFLNGSCAGGVISDGQVIDNLLKRPDANPSSLVSVARLIDDRRLADAIFRRAFRENMVHNPTDCLDILASMPRYLRDRFEIDGVGAVVSKKGASGLQKVLDEGNISFWAVSNGFETLVKTSPMDAFALFDKYRDRLGTWEGGLDRDAHIFEIIVQGNRSNPDASLNWLRQMPTSPFIQSMMEAAITARIKKDPTNISRLTMDSGLAPDATTPFVVGALHLIKNEGRRDLALQLVESIPSDRVRAAVYSETGYWLGGSDPKLALEFAAAAPNAIDRAKSVERLGPLWLKKDPAAAMAFAANRINDPVFSLFLSSAISDRLDIKDPAGSEQRLRSLQSLPGVTKAAIRDSMAATMSQPQKSLLIGIMK